MYYIFFIPKHRIDRHSVHLQLFACSRSDIEVAKWRHKYVRDVSNRAINNRRAINDLYGTIASHDEVWQFYRGI